MALLQSYFISQALESCPHAARLRRVSIFGLLPKFRTEGVPSGKKFGMAFSDINNGEK